MINVEKTIKKLHPQINKYPYVVRKLVFGFFKKLLHEKQLNEFFVQSSDKIGVDFVKSVLEYFNFGYFVEDSQLRNIPKTGRLIIVSNHPLGSLDSLSIIDMVASVRQDIKIVGTDILTNIPQLSNMIVGVDNFSNKVNKNSFMSVVNSLEQENLLIIFPSGEVSRLGIDGIKDGKWYKGFLKFAKKTNTDILPISIKAKNSLRFYLISLIYKKLSTFFLVDEMFRQKNKKLVFKVKKPIKYDQIKLIDEDDLVALLKNHIYDKKSKLKV